MARPKKEGLDYFPLDIDIDQDDKIALVEAKHGPVGFAVAIKLFMKIYKEGYFYKWGEKEHLLFSKRVNVDINLVSEIVNDCVEWDLFNKELFKNENILTSKGIQRRYIEAITRRKEVDLLEKYLLVKPTDFIGNSKIKIFVISDDGKRVNVNINSGEQDNGTHDDDKNPQSKVKESKEKKSKEKDLKDKEEDARAKKNSVVKTLIDNNILSAGGITATLREDINDIFEKFGFEEPDKIIEFAIKDGVRGNGRTWKFIFNRLDGWSKQGVKTVKDAQKLANTLPPFGDKRNGQNPIPRAFQSLQDWAEEEVP